jgi:diguanylate cyclase (GGDEF)-like protein/PAS domain S-box-containing protein
MRLSGPLIDRSLLEDLLSRIEVGVIVTDAKGLVESLSPFAEKLTGWRETEARGQRIEKVFRLTSEGLASDEGSAPERTKASRASDLDESVLLSRNGQRFAVEHTMAPVRDENSLIRSIVIVFHDVSQRKLASLQLTRQASHDSLTGLLNREAFMGRVDHALVELKGNGAPFAVCQVDLEQFNLVNNTCGHVAGDNLIQWVAATLREEAREQDTLARLGGDVFGLLLGRTSPEQASRLVAAALHRLQHFQFTWADKTFSVGASVGLVPVTEGAPAVAEVLAAADHACSLAKRSGRNQVAVHLLGDEELTRSQQEQEWVARIRKNLHEGGVTLFAQPIRPLRRNDQIGLHFEVLLRMTGEGGLLTSAARMIQATERHGLMASIDRWVIRKTMDVLREQPRAVTDRVRLCSINLSGGSFHDTSFLDFIGQQLAQAPVQPSQICFEITETAAIEDLEKAHRLIAELRALGCRFALDDFGSGLASYSHLKDLPVNFLKIAGEFVEDIASNDLDRAMVESINQIARVLGIETVAERVASQAALETILTVGVDYAQGNWVGLPRPLSELLQEA